MELSDDDVFLILKLLNESSFDELHLETNNLKLVVGRRGKVVADRELESKLTRPTEVMPRAEPVVAEKVQASAIGICAPFDNATVETKLRTVEEDGIVAITASTVGTFYRASKPGALPFVEVGTFVTEGDTVCLLEVMKCFISIPAKIRGNIIKVCAENAQMVEYGQELFLVKLAEDREAVLHE